MTMNTKKKNTLLIISVSIQLCTIVFSLFNYLSFTNTLKNNQNWQVSKTQLFQPGQDGLDFTNTLPALAHNALNLSAWRAWHEVSLKQSLPWKEVSLRFLATADSYLYLIFNKTAENFSAVRISYSPLYRSALISAKYTGEFIEYLPITISDLHSTGWQKIKLRKSSSQSPVVEILYNEQIIASYNPTTDFNGTIALRAGKKEILVDDLTIIGDENQTLLIDHFDRLHQFWKSFPSLVITFILLDVIIWSYLKNKKQLQKAWIQFNFMLCLAIVLINLILLIFNPALKNQYPRKTTLTEKVQNLLRIHPQPATNEEAALLKKDDEKLLLKYLPNINEVNKTRIIVIGSSQTEGEGISREGEDLVSQFQKLLAKQNPSDHKFEVLNAGRAGQTASFLLKYLQNQWLQLKPDIVIVNLSSNDEAYGEDPQHFASVLEDFVYLSQKNNFQLVLVAEAISNEYKDKLTNHQIMQEIAQKHHIKFINMHEYLIDHLQEGIIWWDFVHPTSFGYQLIAQKLFDSLQNK